jgi:hypothetical protein
MLVRMFPRKLCALMPVILVMGICLVSHAHAQIAGATLSGTVTDQSGGVVPQAAITNVATGITRTTTTSAAGFYSIPNLLPGTYDVKTTAQGFSAHVSTGVIRPAPAQSGDQGDRRGGRNRRYGTRFACTICRDGASRVRLGAELPNIIRAARQQSLGDIPNYTDIQPSIQISEIKI